MGTVSSALDSSAGGVCCHHLRHAEDDARKSNVRRVSFPVDGEPRGPRRSVEGCVAHVVSNPRTLEDDQDSPGVICGSGRPDEDWWCDSFRADAEPPSLAASQPRGLRRGVEGCVAHVVSQPSARQRGTRSEAGAVLRIVVSMSSQRS